MTCPENVTNPASKRSAERSVSNSKGVATPGISVFAKEAPATRKISDVQVKAAAITVIRNVPADDVPELLAMLGITDHLTGKELMSPRAGVTPSFDHKQKAKRRNGSR